MNHNEQKEDDKYIKCPTCKGRGFIVLITHLPRRKPGQNAMIVMEKVK